jgi:hypothetical protein
VSQKFVSEIPVSSAMFHLPKSVNDPVHMATAKRIKADGHTAKDITAVSRCFTRDCTGTWPLIRGWIRSSGTLWPQL